eukprot:1357548-Amorphochlora_amoeboformis.AAC.1
MLQPVGIWASGGNLWVVELIPENPNPDRPYPNLQLNLALTIVIEGSASDRTIDIKSRDSIETEGHTHPKTNPEFTTR